MNILSPGRRRLGRCPSNVALCVNPRETYAKVRYEGAHYYMAEALLDSVMGDGI